MGTLCVRHSGFGQSNHHFHVQKTKTSNKFIHLVGSTIICNRNNHYSIHNKKSEIDDISKRVAETSENSKVRIGLRMTDKWDTIYNIMKLNRNKYLKF